MVGSAGRRSIASTKVVVTRSLIGMFRFRVTPVAPLTACHVLVRVERRMASCKFFDRSTGGGRAGVKARPILIHVGGFCSRCCRMASATP